MPTCTIGEGNARIPGYVISPESTGRSQVEARVALPPGTQAAGAELLGRPHEVRYCLGWWWKRWVWLPLGLLRALVLEMGLAVLVGTPPLFHLLSVPSSPEMPFWCSQESSAPALFTLLSASN